MHDFPSRCQEKQANAKFLSLCSADKHLLQPPLALKMSSLTFLLSRTVIRKTLFAQILPNSFLEIILKGNFFLHLKLFLSINIGKRQNFQHSINIDILKQNIALSNISNAGKISQKCNAISHIKDKYIEKFTSLFFNINLFILIVS